MNDQNLPLNNPSNHSKLKQLKELYVRHSLKPAVTQASVSLLEDDHDGDMWLKVLYSYRDPTMTKTVSFQKNFLDRGSRFQQIGSVEEVANDVLLQVESKDGQHTAVIKTKDNPKSPNDKADQFIVLYNRSTVKKVIEVKKLNEKMRIVDNAYLAWGTLNLDASILMTVVELDKDCKKKTDSVNGEDKKEEKDTIDIDAHAYRQTWGEKFTGVYHTSVAVIDVVNEKCVLLDLPGVSLAQPFFHKSCDGKTLQVGCIGFREDPYKLGIIYCHNRQSALYACQLDSDLANVVSPCKPEVRHEGDFMVWSPRVHSSPSTGFDSKVYFLEFDAGGAHNKSARLRQYCFEAKTVTTIVDNRSPRKFEVKQDGQVEYDPIGPIYEDQLPQDCFSQDGKHMLVNTQGPIRSIVYCVNLQDGCIHPLDSPLPSGSFSVLQVKHNWLAVRASAPNHFPQLFVSKWTPPSGQCAWRAVEEEDKLEKIVCETFNFASKHFKDKHVNCFWITGEDGAQGKATILRTHGGPHSAYDLAYFKLVALYIELGFNVLLVNYVGSTGVDDDYVNALLGRVGTVDIDDFKDAIDCVIKHKQIDASKLILAGGSHSGLMVTSMCGQHPEMNWLACIARNPVIDMASLVATSDIPDWTVVESLGASEVLAYEQIYGRSCDVVEKLHSVSPIAHVQNVKTPTLLFLGCKDLRVPMQQGLLYHRLLLARGIESRCLVYEDDHALSKIDVDLDCFLNEMSFIAKHMFGDNLHQA